MITKAQKIIIPSSVALLVLVVVFFVYGANPILHLMYSDDYILKTSMDTDIVKTYYELYPENVSRIVRVLDQQPAIVFESTQGNEMAFLAVGNFEGKKLTFMYSCFSFDSSVFQTESTVTPELIRDNFCFEK